MQSESGGPLLRRNSSGVIYSLNAVPDVARSLPDDDDNDGDAPMDGPKPLSATNLATYHHLQCDLYLHSVYHRAPVSALTANKDGKGHTPAPRPGATSRAHFSRGLKWEHDLLHALDRANQLLTILSVPVPHDGLIATIDCDERDHFYIANASFWPPQRALDALYAQAGISNPVRFGLAKPDLIEVKRAEGVTTWRVIDAKSSASVKTAHHVQIYFYHLCLSHILPGSYVPATTAGVWLPSSPPSASSLVSTPIALLASSLRPFLFSRLPRLLALPAADVSWHLNPLCRTCPYEPAHRTRALTEGAIGAIPNVSVADKGALERLLGAARARDAKLGIGDIEDLHLLFSNPNAVDALERAFPSGVKSAKRILGVPSRTRPHTSRRSGRHSLPQSQTRTPANPSAVLEAALTRTVQVIPRRSFTLPVAEDLALVLSLVLDPATDGVALFSLSLFPSPVVTLPSRLLDQMGKAAQLVPALAATIRATLALGQVVRAQFYVFSSQERTALQRHLIDAALVAGSDKTGDDKGPTDDEDDVRLCIAALCEGASLLATAFQPLILSGALLDFLSRKGTRTKAELRTCLRRMGVTDLARTETVERLRLRVAEEVERLKQLGGRAQPDSDDGAGTAGKEIGQLPLVVVLKREIERLVALPVPGYWDLPECAVALLGSAAAYASDDEIFASYDAGRTVEAEGTLRKRNEGIKRVLDAVRARITKEGRQLLVNEAKPLSAEFMDLCEQPHIRKLFYMQQFEVLAKLSELWRNRVDGCPDAPVLEHISSSSSSAGGTLHTFRLLSGTLDAPGGDKPHAPDQQRSFFDFLLAPDDDSEGSDSDIPPEALFDDLPVMGMVFPLNRWTRPRWDMQPARVRRSLLVADVRDITIDADGMHTRVTLCTWGERAAQPGVGRRYRLSPRLVDFNLTKALSTLLELDMRCAGEGGDDDEGDGVPPFVQLISDPRALALEQAPEGARLGSRFLRREHAIQRTFRERADLGTEEARTLLLKASQRQATRRILSSRLAVVWGPPGAGKTHTIASSLLRLLECQAGIAPPQILFLTAMTHAAIDACLSKLELLMKCYKSISGLSTAWLDKVKIEHVLKGNEHPLPAKNTPNTHIYAGTVFQLYNFSKRRALHVDCVVIDEAGQLGLGSAALVLRSLGSRGRIVIAGDSEQLAPIFAAQYPKLETRLFGSILDCVMHLYRAAQEGLHAEATMASLVDTEHSSEQVSSQLSTIVQLTENFRLNPDLGDFVSTIYSRAFKPQKVQVQTLATHLGNIRGLHVQCRPGLEDVLESAKSFLVDLSRAMLRKDQPRLRPPVAAAASPTDLLTVPGPLPISLAMISLKARTMHSSQLGYEAHVRGEAALAASLIYWLRKSCPDDSIFVATPHRIQRYAVKEALKSMKSLESDEDELAQAMTTLAVSDATTTQVTIDTVERLQGSEAAFVICLFSDTFASSSSSTSLNFLLERRRLNVAISRAKTLCILVTSNEVLRPSVRVLANEEAAKGYTFLRSYEDRAWKGTIEIDLDTLQTLA